MKFLRTRSSSIREQLCLAFVWALGLISGVTFFLLHRDAFPTLVRVYSLGTASAFCAFFPIFFPFGLSVLACALGAREALYGIAFCRAVAFSFTFSGFLISFPSAGWLIRLLLGFNGICAVPLLYGFWIRCLACKNRLSASELLLFAAAFLFIGSVDYCLVMPFAAGL